MKKYYLTIACLLFINALSFAQVTLNLKFFMEGYYKSGGLMRPVLYNEMVAGATTTQTDTVAVSLIIDVSPYPVLQTVKTIVNTDGTASAYFSLAVIGNSYYIHINHRNTLCATAYPSSTMLSVTNYDFSDSVSHTFGHAVVMVDNGVWAFFNCDLNQDANIDLLDYPPLDYAMQNGLWGYHSSDINGDGNVDLFDYVIYDVNLNVGVFGWLCRPF